MPSQYIKIDTSAKNNSSQKRDTPQITTQVILVDWVTSPTQESKNENVRVAGECARIGARHARTEEEIIPSAIFCGLAGGFLNALFSEISSN